MLELAYSLGYEIAAVITQKRQRPDPMYYLGSGKVEEARDAATELGADLIIVNADLKAGQIVNLQKAFERVLPPPIEAHDLHDSPEYTDHSGHGNRIHDSPRADDSHDEAPVEEPLNAEAVEGMPRSHSESGDRTRDAPSDEAQSTAGHDVVRSSGHGGDSDAHDSEEDNPSVASGAFPHGMSHAGPHASARAFNKKAASTPMKDPGSPFDPTNSHSSQTSTSDRKAHRNASRGSGTPDHEVEPFVDPFEVDAAPAPAAIGAPVEPAAGAMGAPDASPATGGARRRAAEPRRLEVFDRVRVILEIFSERARTQEARLQVELAKLHYEMPLVKESISLMKKGERPGFLAGGEYEVVQYHDMIKRRMARIRHDLSHISQERDVRRKHRRRGGFHLVSLAGYTNAGKSSLLRALTGDRAIAENRYFSTLETRTRRAVDERREILVTDTVGFMDELPPWLIESFRSTLEEIALADVIVLVVDVSDPLPEIRRRLHASLDVLADFQTSEGGSRGRGDVRAGTRKATRADRSGRSTGPSRPGPPTARGRSGSDAHARDDVFGPGSLAPVLIAFNKTDRTTHRDVTAKLESLAGEGLLGPHHVLLSVKTGDGLDSLYEAIHALLPTYTTYQARLPADPASEAFLSWIHDAMHVITVDRSTIPTEAVFEVRPELRTVLADRASAIGVDLTVIEPS